MLTTDVRGAASEELSRLVRDRFALSVRELSSSVRDRFALSVRALTLVGANALLSVRPLSLSVRPSGTLRLSAGKRREFAVGHDGPPAGEIGLARSFW